MFRRQAQLLLATVALAAVLPGRGANSVLTITEATNATIMSTDGANPRGNQSILVGTRGTQAQGILDRGLLRFDLSDFPTNAVIRSVTLELTVVQIPQNPVPSIFNLHRILTSWDRSTTWANAKAGLPWAAPGGKEGVDYVANASAGQEVDEEDVYDFGPTDGLNADVQAWVANPSSNNGWLLVTDSEGMFFTARHFGSSASDNPPRLIVEYSTGAREQPTMNEPLARNNLFTFSFVPSVGQPYAIETRTNLSLGNWTVLTNIAASPATNAIVVTNTLSAQSEFFRIKLQ